MGHRDFSALQRIEHANPYDPMSLLLQINTMQFSR